MDIRYHSNRRPWAVVTALGVLITMMFVAGSVRGKVSFRIGRAEKTATDDAEACAADLARCEPLSIRPQPRRVLRVTQEDYDWIHRQIQPIEVKRLSPSYCLHVFRARGLDGRFSDPSFPSSKALLAPLLDSATAKQVFGESFLLRGERGFEERRPPGNVADGVPFQRGRNMVADGRQAASVARRALCSQRSCTPPRNMTELVRTLNAWMGIGVTFWDSRDKTGFGSTSIEAALVGKRDAQSRNGTTWPAHRARWSP